MVPGLGWSSRTPTALYVHAESDGRAFQYAQNADGEGVTAHASCFGVGSASMRQTNASPYCTVPAVEKPAACSAIKPLAGWPGAHPRSILPPPKCVKSTMTVTPEVAVQADCAAAPAAAIASGMTTADATTARIAVTT